MVASKLGLLAVAASLSGSVLAQQPAVNPAATPLATPYDGYSYVGCYTDNNGFRALANQGPATAGGQPNMTIQNCVDVCGAYSYIGLEYSQEARLRKYSQGMASDRNLVLVR